MFFTLNPTKGTPPTIIHRQVLMVYPARSCAKVLPRAPWEAVIAHAQWEVGISGGPPGPPPGRAPGSPENHAFSIFLRNPTAAEDFLRKSWKSLEFLKIRE